MLMLTDFSSYIDSIMLYRLTPTLIEQGFVYIAESPLFEITTKEKTYFAYTEQEKQRIIDIIGDKKYTIQQFKRSWRK